MTLPDERYRAVMQTIEFLTEVCNTPRVPKVIKQRASSLLRHYPSAWDMKRAAENCPDVFQERMEPVTRIMMQYQQEQQEEKEK
jgi:hypothetical protein